MGRLTAAVTMILLTSSGSVWAQTPMPPPGTPPGTPAPGTLPGTPAPGTMPAPAPASGPTAGGLTAPDPMPDPEPDETDQQLDDAKEEDSGRGLKWIYIDVEGGYQYVDLNTFEADESTLTVGFVKTNSSGGFVGVGAGLTLGRIFTVGPRFRAGFFDDWQIFTVGGDIGFRIPIGLVEPHFSLGGGYAGLGSLSDALGGVSDAINIRGGYGRVGGGLDFWLGNYVTLGLGASWEFMGLVRPGVDPASLNPETTSDLSEARRNILAAEGSGYGSTISALARLGVQF